MLARAVRNPVTSDALRTASREPSGLKSRSEPLGLVFVEPSEESRAQILMEDPLGRNAGIINVDRDEGSGLGINCRGGWTMLVSVSALAKESINLTIWERLRDDSRVWTSSSVRTSIIAVVVFFFLLEEGGREGCILGIGCCIKMIRETFIYIRCPHITSD